ncbi:MAG TPA: hypothetical protein GYA07_02910 [Verrucomicrobia bacterium]|nr:hypothetical protein [Verrucomicrobiota bacterium]
MGSTLSLNVSFVGNSGSIDVYGLRDGDPGENWPEATTTFNNAPGIINTGLGTWQADTNLIFLGTITGPAVGSVSSEPETLDLASFLEQDTDGLVTFVLVANPGWFGINSKETVNGTPPTLIMPFAVPDPGLSNLVWAVGNGAWNIGSAANWQDGVGGLDPYQEVSGVGNRVRFDDTSSGTSPIEITLEQTVTPRSITNDSTKDYTITGPGNIAGSTGVTKQGTGTLTLETFNSFSGPIVLDGGTLRFGLLALGSGPIFFNGGELEWASGNTEDISARAMIFNATAFLDTGGNEVFLANAIGNGSPGGLVKTGAGRLALLGGGTYTGNTVVEGGILTLGVELINSPAIVVQSGAVLDVVGLGEMNLNAGVSQVLAGTGSVDGTLNVGLGTSITPATNGVAGTLTILNSVGNGMLRMNGGTLFFDISTTESDLVVVNGNLDLTAGTVQLIVGGPLANGTYKLIEYTGSIVGGSAANLVLAGFDQAGQIAYLSDDTPGRIDLVVATESAANLVWQGDVNNLWDVGNSANWLNGGADATFSQGDSVTFNATGAGTPIVDLVGSLLPSSVTVDAASDYTFSSTSGGRLTGDTGLTKSGSGKLTILTANNNKGPVVIQAGTLQVGDGFTPSHIGDGGFTNNGTLIFSLAPDDDRIIGGLAGPGSVTHNGQSTLTIASNATYTGPTTIGVGATLEVGNGGPEVFQSSSVQNDGTLILNSSETQSYAGLISGQGDFAKAGSGTLILNTLNTYLGNTIVNGGTLRFGGENLVPVGGSGVLSVGAGGTVELNGFDQLVNGLGGAAGGRILNNLGTTTNTLTINNNAAAASDAAILDNEGSGGIVRVVKMGAAQQELGGASAFTGGLVVSNGNVRLRNNNAAAGSGTITLAGGGLVIQNGRSIGNPLDVLEDGRIEGQGNMTYDGPISGDSSRTLTLIAATTFSFGAGMNNSPFEGTFFMENSGGTFRCFGWNGSPLATFDLGEGTAVFAPRNRNTTIQMGALRGGPSTVLSGATDGGQVDIPSGYSIGAKNLSTTFGGTIQDAAANRITFLTKVGTGTLTLTNANIIYSGATTVSNGVLALAGEAGLTNSGTINVVAPGSLSVSGRADNTLWLGAGGNAQTLAGDGTITGNVVVDFFAPVTIQPGFANGTGVLTVTGDVTLNGNATTVMEVRTEGGPSADRLAAGTIMANGTLVITNIGNITGTNTFQLFSGNLVGTFNSVITPVLEDVVFNTDNLYVDGTITVMGPAGMDLTPTNLVFEVSDGNLTLSWPASHIGWRLQVQTNSLDVGLSDNWVDIPEAIGTNQISFPIDQVNGTVFFRMITP